jgi:hypothetical protein
MWAWISAASPGIMIHLEERLTSNVYIRVLEDVMVCYHLCKLFIPMESSFSNTTIAQFIQHTG